MTLQERLNNPDSVELVEYELSEALLKQGVNPNVYPRLTAQITQAIEKDILELIKDVPLDQPGDDDMDNISLKAYIIFRKGVNWQNAELRLKLEEYFYDV